MTSLGDALALTGRWCAIPSYEDNAAGMARQVADILGWLQTELGVTIIAPSRQTGEHAPVIHARLDVGAARSVILYNMYDVMPAVAEGWSNDPWTGGRGTMENVGEVFIARGAENNKGPLAGMLVALRDMHRAGRLKVNVEILLDGQEEIGSQKMRAYLAAADCPMPRCAGGLFPSFCEYGGGAPRVYLGFSGMAKGRITVSGGAWGGPSTPIHSSNAPWIANPARVLVDALSGFGGAVTGALGRVDLDAEAQGLIDNLARDFDPDAELRFRTSERFATTGDAAAQLRSVLSTASMNISSLRTLPVGDSAIIPHSAEAMFDLRVPPGLDGDACLKAFIDHLAVQPGLAGVSLEVGETSPAVRYGLTSAAAQALLTAYDATSRAPQIWPWALGSAPGHAFARHTDSFMIGGAGRGGHAHGVNEFLSVAGFDRFLKSVDVWLSEMAT